MIKRFFFCLAGLMVFAVGCGEKKTEIDPRFSSPEKAYNIWIDAGVKGDLVTSLECITEESKKFVDIQAKQRDIFLQKMVENSKVFKEYSIIDSKVKENRAVLLTKGPDGNTIVIPFKRDAEGWKVDLIAMFSM